MTPLYLHILMLLLTQKQAYTVTIQTSGCDMTGVSLPNQKYYLWQILHGTAIGMRTFILEMKLYMFRTVPLSFIGSYSMYTQRSIPILLESCLQTYMTYTIAVCTVNNS
jgi:hypothetical protein